LLWKGFSLTETILGLLRHGQTDWNIDLRLQGSSDIPLNDTGREQALTAGKFLDSESWDLILSSPLSRARDTAEIVAAELGKKVIILPELIERSFGVAEGLDHTAWRKLYESGQEIEGLESLDDLRARTHLLLTLIAENYSGKRVLAVSHGAFIRKVLTIVTEGELPREGERLSNASLNTFNHQNGNWSIADYNPLALGI
jgi:broad specificity phosphatase PhoE